MGITKELIEKAKKCETVQELLALAKENDIEMNEEQANNLLIGMKKAGELSDRELDNVSGGGCGSIPNKCPKCQSKHFTHTATAGVLHYHCKDCGYKWNIMLL